MLILAFFLHIVEHVLYVLVLLNLFNKFFKGGALFGGNVFQVVRNTFKFRGNNFETVVFQIFLDIGIFFKRTIKEQFLLRRARFRQHRSQSVPIPGRP